MQHGAVFSDIDFFAREHCVNVLAQPGLLGQFQEQTHGLAGNPVLRIIEVKTQGLQSELFTALWIVREELSKV